MMEETCFIVNPASRSGKSRRLIESLRQYLERELPKSELRFTQSPNHATELGRKAAEEGFRRLVAVGGDGTLNEVANGVLDLPIKKRPAIGVISTGTGGDFSRRLRELYSFPKDFSWLLRPGEATVDVGAVAMEDLRGVASNRYFLNVADAGISGEVVRRVNSSPKRFGTLEYLVATLRSVRSYQPPRVSVSTEDAKGRVRHREIDLLLAVIANGRYFGGGMCIAPQAELDDGRLDFLLADRLPYTSLLAQLPRVYRRLRFDHPKVEYSEGQALSLEAESGEIPLDLDGEFFRVRKAAFRILPRALRILLPQELTPR
ncbi:MAG TPA: diacylglycerol kinase family protein [bacterium]|nr:diacylglycerol kinase family protein [bacterium]